MWKSGTSVCWNTAPIQHPSPKYWTSHMSMPFAHIYHAIRICLPWKDRGNGSLDYCGTTSSDSLRNLSEAQNKSISSVYRILYDYTMSSAAMLSGPHDAEIVVSLNYWKRQCLYRPRRFCSHNVLSGQLDYMQNPKSEIYAKEGVAVSCSSSKLTILFSIWQRMSKRKPLPTRVHCLGAFR